MNQMLKLVVALVRKKGVLRPRDLAEVDISREYLRLACEMGLVERVARGLYSVPGVNLPNPTLAEVCKRVPNGVICLLSALSFHGLTTQIPHTIQIAIGHKARAPKIDFVGVQYFRFSGDALTEGVETHDLGGVEVKVYSPAKTIADCFKLRNKIGLSIAIEALRDGLQQRKARIDDLVSFGRICRVERIMRPYTEALVG